LYGDQDFSRFELEILHTPSLQRLYELKQLGFTDRVFPDAIHARFNHVVGVVEVVQKMSCRLLAWLDGHHDCTFDYAVPAGRATAVESVSGKELATLLRDRLAALRLMALLHDTAHGAFGHTLEDEVQVFAEKHDDPPRQVRFFNALVAQLLYFWVTERRLHDLAPEVLEELSNLGLSENLLREVRWAEELAADLTTEERKVLLGHLRDLELAFRLLLRIEFAHGHGQTEPDPETLLVTRVADKLGGEVLPQDLVFHRDLFLIDMVGNTICADLLDYARRDADNAGLRVQFDDRFLRYLCVVSVDGEKSPTGKPAIRTAIQIFTDKMRHDVLSEISGILKARYLINERALFHPIKCAAGAMLGTAVQFLGLQSLPPWMQVLGDTEFISTLAQLATGIESVAPALAPSSTNRDRAWQDIVRATWPADSPTSTEVTRMIQAMVPAAGKSLSTEQLDEIVSRARAARSLLGRLRSRRLPKLVYRLRKAHHTGGESDKTIAEKFSKAKNRFALEREIESICNLPLGSIVVHCPVRKTSMKVAQALVVGSNLAKSAHLRDVSSISPEGLEPYEEEIRAVEKMYESIWQLHAFMDPSFAHKRSLVELAFERAIGFPDDRLLSDELSHEEQDGVFGLLTGDLRDHVAPVHLTRVVARVDAELVGRKRLGNDQGNAREFLLRIIDDVSREARSSAIPASDAQLGLPGVETGR